MYNSHRGIGPGPVPSRLADLLDQIRAEFDQQNGRSTEYEGQLHHQAAEMDQVRGSVYKLEQQYIQLKKNYEEEIERLRRELDLRSGNSSGHQGPPQHSGPAQGPPPPIIGHGQSTLFGNIMAGGGQGASALAPPPQDQNATQGLPAHLSQNAAMNAAGPPQHQYPGYPPGPGVNGYGQQAPHPTASPGPGRSRIVRPPPGAGTPQQGQAVPFPGSPPGGTQATPPQHQRPLPPAQTSGQNGVVILADLKPETLPAHQTKSGPDWYAIFNPQVRRTLDVDLVHTLEHNSVVCCVRFSHDGRYVATGCNRSAQIFDTQTGQLLTKLTDENAKEEGDLYIRSVCFSPDGKFLATGAEDKIIRVWDIAEQTIKMQFQGHDQDIYCLDFARNGRHIASGSGDRTVRIWDLETGLQNLQLSIEDGVTTVALSADGRLVAAGSLDKSVRVWDTQSGYPCERLEGPDGHKDSVYSVAFAPNGQQLVSGSLDKTIKMWELSPVRPIVGNANKSGKCIRTFQGHKDFVLSVALTPDGAWVLSGSKDRGVEFWDPRTGEPQLYLQGHKNSVISVAPSPDGRHFATGSGDARAKIWSYGPYHQ